MSRSISLNCGVLAGARVAGQLTYIPAHFKGGKEMSSRCVIPVYANSHRGHNQKTGEEGRSNSFKLIAWGKLADTCCKSLPKGKAIDIEYRPESYMGKLYNQDGSLRYDTAGQAIEVLKVAFTIKDIIFGEESAKMVAEEIQTGRRPHNWNVPNHPDFQMWIQILTQRQASTWDCRSNTFGYARVVPPSGQGTTINYAYYAPKAAPAAMPTPTPGFTGNYPANYGMPELVANAFGANPPAAKFDPMTGQPLNPTPMAKFDPMTGQPLTASTGFFNPTAPATPGFPNTVAAGGTSGSNLF